MGPERTRSVMTTKILFMEMGKKKKHRYPLGA
jgi:hypothetical protein